MRRTIVACMSVIGFPTLGSPDRSETLKALRRVYARKLSVFSGESLDKASTNRRRGMPEGRILLAFGSMRSAPAHHLEPELVLENAGRTISPSTWWLVRAAYLKRCGGELSRVSGHCAYNRRAARRSFRTRTARRARC